MSEDADALFVFVPESDDGPGREPALLFETPGEMKMFAPGSSEPIDPRISTFLSQGFGLLAGGQWFFPLLDDWRLSVGDGLFALVDPNGLRAYSCPLEEVTPEWLAEIRRRGRCTVFTGVGIGLDIETFTFDRVSAAAADGNLVGAIVPFEGAATGGWLDRLKRRFGGSM